MWTFFNLPSPLPPLLSAQLQKSKTMMTYKQEKRLAALRRKRDDRLQDAAYFESCGQPIRAAQYRRYAMHYCLKVVEILKACK